MAGENLRYIYVEIFIKNPSQSYKASPAAWDHERLHQPSL